MALFRKDLWEIISFVDFILNPDQLQTMSVTGLCDRHYFLLLKKNVHLVIAVLKLYIFLFIYKNYSDVCRIYSIQICSISIIIQVEVSGQQRILIIQFQNVNLSKIKEKSCFFHSKMPAPTLNFAAPHFAAPVT